jgi:hypothetical protein
LRRSTTPTAPVTGPASQASATLPQAASSACMPSRPYTSQEPSRILLPNGPSGASIIPTRKAIAAVRRTRMTSCYTPDRTSRGRSPTAEAEDLKSFQCGFESHRPYCLKKPILQDKHRHKREGRVLSRPLLHQRVHQRTAIELRPSRLPPGRPCPAAHGSRYLG